MQIRSRQGSRQRPVVHIVTAVAFLIVASSTPGAARAQTFDNTLLVVLDVSGSMKESVEGGVKNELAQRGLLATLASVPVGTAVGLRLLGQGAPGADECAATTMAVPFGAFDRDSWSSSMARIRWDGATPLVNTMRAALDDLRSAPSSRREMLIIGDGEETCGEDPVGVARAEAGGIRIHTISLGERFSQQLAGIALVTGGTYTRAFDESTFETATTDSLPTAASADPQPAGAGGAPAMLEVILDVSNSMWGQIDGRAKIELAREALRAAMLGLPDSVSVGLRAYGHRISVQDKEAGCDDTELVIAPAPGAGPRVVERADGLTPRGQTPIATSLEAAAQDLRAHGGSGILLLISDGAESCGGDPVAVAAALRESGLPVVIHTVGLGVDADAAAALEQLAGAGGGQYFDAPTATELVAGVDTAVRSTSEFILAAEDTNAFPRMIERVRGGSDAMSPEIIEPGTYSFTEHLFREQRYFAVRGTPGEQILLSGLVCALEIGRKRDGTVTFQGNPSMMAAEGNDVEGNRLRGGGNMIVRGDMGDWVEWKVTVSEDGLARFRIGRTQGTVHRDMVFRVER